MGKKSSIIYRYEYDMDKNSTTYDTIIIGGGIAGLYTGINLLKSNPKRRVALAEKYSKFGGRTFTFYADISGVKYQWEEGAARISDMHKLTLDLLKEYKLKVVPISPDVSYKESGAYEMEENYFEKSTPIFLKPLHQLSSHVLETSTIYSLLCSIHGKKQTESLLNRYPYRAELNVMRADMALNLFKNEFGSDSGYSICAEGLSELIKRMKEEFERLGGITYPHHELTGLVNQTCTFANGPPSKGSTRPQVVLEGKRIVFAIPVDSLRKIKPFNTLDVLKHLTMKPLVRLYAVFPPLANGKQWFEPYTRIITAERPRYIIPIDPQKGVIQISYTDSSDTVPIMKMNEELGETGLGKEIVEDLRTLLGIEIPDPIIVKIHPWEQGVTYWLPGNYDPYKLSKELRKPFKDKQWYLTGESYSTRQCWIEGALEHASMLCKIL